MSDSTFDQLVEEGMDPTELCSAGVIKARCNAHLHNDSYLKPTTLRRASLVA